MKDFVFDYRWNEAISEAMRIIPREFRDAIKCGYVIGKDPAKIGMSYEYDETLDGRSYAETAHVCYPWHIPKNVNGPYIMLPAPIQRGENPVYTVLHELGHILHFSIEFETPDLPTVTKYAGTCPMERFAEAWCAYVVPRYTERYRAFDAYEPVDGRVKEYFDNLKRELDCGKQS